MTHRITVSCFVLALLAQVTPVEGLMAQSEGPLVFILAGQSNMVGQGRTADLAAGQTLLPPTVRYFRGSEASAPTDGEQFGPELTLGRELASAMPGREIVLVKHAVNGSSLLDWAPDWNSERAALTPHPRAGPLYSQLLDMLRQLDVGEGAELGAIFWMQGERDARVPEVGAEYFANLAGLVAAFRRDLAAPELPFILGLVNPPAEHFPAVRRVRDAQRRAASEIPGVHLVATDDLTKWDDDLHYDTEGILELGRRFAVAFLESRQPR